MEVIRGFYVENILLNFNNSDNGALKFHHKVHASGPSLVGSVREVCVGLISMEYHRYTVEAYAYQPNDT